MGKSKEIAALKAELEEMEASFNLRWEADMRAIKRWQEDTGRVLVWPDHADLCVWLLGQVDSLQRKVKVLQSRLDKPAKRRA